MNIRKQHRIEESEARQCAYDTLTLDQKLALTRVRRGESKKEVARLLALKETA